MVQLVRVETVLLVLLISGIAGQVWARLADDCKAIKEDNQCTKEHQSLIGHQCVAQSTEGAISYGLVV